MGSEMCIRDRAYAMMFVVLPLYVLYWNFVLFPEKKKGNNSPRH